MSEKVHHHIGIGNDVWISYESVIFSGVSNVLEMKNAKSCKNPFRCSERKYNDLSLISESLIQIAIHPHHVSVSICCICNVFADKIM